MSYTRIMELVGELPDGMPDKIQSDVNVAVRDYKCVALEDVEVPAGIFEKSYKVSYRGEVTISIGGEAQTTVFTNVTSITLTKGEARHPNKIMGILGAKTSEWLKRDGSVSNWIERINCQIRELNDMYHQVYGHCGSPWPGKECP